MTLIVDKPFYAFKLYKNNDSSFAPLYFCGYENIVYGGIKHVAIPCQIENLTYNVDTEAEPTITIGDVDATISRLILLYGGLEGLYLGIRKLIRRILDDGSVADGGATPLEVFVITQLLNRTPSQFTYKLQSRVVATNTTVPGRILTNTCTWKIYRGSDCNYQGTAMFDVNNQPTTDSSRDICALTKQACLIRGNYANFSGIVTMRRLT
jgi:lambda family phage minor tail protein L